MIAILFVVSSLGGRIAKGQVTTADITGTVADISGASISGAKVTVSNTATQVRTTTSSVSGSIGQSGWWRPSRFLAGRWAAAQLIAGARGPRNGSMAVPHQFLLSPATKTDCQVIVAVSANLLGPIDADKISKALAASSKEPPSLLAVGKQGPRQRHVVQWRLGWAR
jgi:hypothetical protein